MNTHTTLPPRIVGSKARVYNAFDAVIMMLLPRAKMYRALERSIRSDQEKLLALETGAARNIRRVYGRDPSFSAYASVPAQFCLIHLDAFGENPFHPVARAAAADLARVFQWLKIADIFVDDAGGLRVANLQRLGDLVHERVAPGSDVELFLVEGYAGMPPVWRSYLSEAYRCETQQYEVGDAQRLVLRGEQSLALGELQYEILRDRFESLPLRAKSFFRLSAKAAGYLDDWRDFQIDRASGYGYRADFRRKLFFAAIKYTWESVKILKGRERRRHFQCLALAGLYMVRQFLGVRRPT